MTSLTARQCTVLRTLLGMEKPIATSKIASQVGITPRMVRYDLRAIERWLGTKNVRLMKKPNQGILLEASDEVRMDLIRELGHLTGYRLILPPIERLHLLIFYLLTESGPLLARQLAVRLGVSRSTVLMDMDKAEKWLLDRNLSLIRRPHFGLKVSGKEHDRRETVVGFLLHNLGRTALLALCQGSKMAFQSRMKGKVGLLRELSTFVQHLGLGCSRRFVDAIETMLHLRLTDSAYASLVLHLAIQMDRIQQGKIVEVAPECMERLRGLAEFSTAKVVAEQIEQRLNIPLSESEVAYIAMHLSGAKSKRAVADIVGVSDAERIEPQLLQVVDGVLAEASLYLHPYLRVDRQLIRGLAAHLGPALKRLRFNLPIRNPLLEDVRTQYPDIFRVARKSIVVLERELGRTVPEEEISYITMHLGAAMERLRSFPRIRRRVVVVCAEGVATGWLLLSRIEAELPEIEVVEVMSALEVSRKGTGGIALDGVISTIRIEVNDIPVIVVSPLLRHEDIASIREVLKLGITTFGRAGIVSRTDEPSLAELITAETIGLRVPARHWRDVVDRAGGLLLSIGAIEVRYIEAMKEVIVTHGPYGVVDQGIILLHARPEDGVRQVCMSLVTLQEPVHFGHPENDPVDLAIVIGAVDHHGHLRALSEVVKLLHDRMAIGRIRSATREQDVIDLISTISRGQQRQAGQESSLNQRGHSSSD